jgi:glycosyltransferase involved in cell wall biosynthesis
VNEGAPRFSVIVPTYGRPAFLAEAVHSILAQDSSRDLEVIVVDDGSPDPVESPSSDVRVRIIRRDTNGGPASARNTGLDEAQGDFIAFCDDDDLFTPDRLALAEDGLLRSPVALCFNRYLDAQLRRPVRLEGNVADSVLDDMAPHLGRTALKRDVCPRFDESLDAGEDIEWWLRLAQQPGITVTTVARVGYLVRRHPEERTRTGLASRVESREALMSKHADYFATHRRARGFAYKRIGLMEAQLGDHSRARRAYLKSLRARPSLRTASHLVRSLRPNRRSTGSAPKDEG